MNDRNKAVPARNSIRSTRDEQMAKLEASLQQPAGEFDQSGDLATDPAKNSDAPHGVTETELPEYEQRPIPPTIPAKHATLAEHTANTLDNATVVIVEQIRTLQGELSDLERLVVENAARVKTEIRGHIEIGSTALDLTEIIRERMNELKRNYISNSSAVIR